MIKRMFLAALLISVPVLVGCAGDPPKEDMDKAKAAKTTATEAKADAYATDQFDAANKAMAEADALVAKKEYDKARVKYQEAIKLYGEAAKSAPAKIAEVKTATDDFIKNCETTWTKNEKAMMAAAARLKADDKKAVTQMYTDCKTKLAEAKKLFADGDFKGSRAVADDASQLYGKINEKLTAKK